MNASQEITRVKWILFKPSHFFAAIPSPVSDRLSSVLAFSLVIHWIGSGGQFLWRVATGSAIERHLIQLLGMDRSFDPSRLDALTGFSWQAGFLILDPFFALIKYFFVAVFIHLGVKIFIGRATAASVNPSFENTFKIVALGQVAQIYTVLPLVGPWAAGIGSLILTFIGVRETYRVSSARALLVALFPQLLSFFIISMMIGFGVVLILAFLSKFLTMA